MWVFTKQKTFNRNGKSVGCHKNLNRRKPVEKYSRNHSFFMTPCVADNENGFAFETFWPLVYKDKIQGYLNCVFNVGEIMDICVSKNIFSNFRINLYENEKLIYVNKIISTMHKDRRSVVRNIDFRGKTWRLLLKPKPDFHARVSILNLSLLIFGLAASAAMAMLFYLLIRKMELYKNVGDRARIEVNERKLAEKELKTNEKKLAALVAELDGKNEELETFVYSVSHDLKTPIVTIDGFVGALQEDYAKKLSGSGLAYLNYISAAARKMETLINELIELSRIGRVEDLKSEFSFADIINETLKTLKPQLEARKICVNIQQNLPVMYGEKKRLSQVIENLLTNSIKYMGKNNLYPQIDIGAQKQNGQIVFFIKDNGIGIEKKYFDKIFQVFQRLPAAKKIEEGTGIGLAIIKRIIEHHQGRIWLTSEPGQGSTFFFTLQDKEL